MTPGDLNECFDAFTGSAFRFEGLGTYRVESEALRIEAWRCGSARPERSVRTSPWLARIAVTTAQGKYWQRARVLDEPLTEYEEYELQGYVESQAAGEEIRIIRRAVAPEVPDFWLFDDTVAVILSYDRDGRFTGTEPGDLALCRAARSRALGLSAPLNEFLADLRRAQRAA